MSSPELAIRLRRADFNRALGAGDLAAIGPILAPNVVLVTGTDSAVLSGRKAQLLAWKREFGAKERVFYTRTPDTIISSPVEPIAMEQGQWFAASAPGGEATASGIYSAKWRNVGGDWVIEAEIYTTLG